MKSVSLIKIGLSVLSILSALLFIISNAIFKYFPPISYLLIFYICVLVLYYVFCFFKLKSEILELLVIISSIIVFVWLIVFIVPIMPLKHFNFLDEEVEKLYICTNLIPAISVITLIILSIFNFILSTLKLYLLLKNRQIFRNFKSSYNLKKRVKLERKLEILNEQKKVIRMTRQKMSKKKIGFILLFFLLNIFILITLSLVLSNYVDWYKAYKKFGDMEPFWEMFDGKCLIFVSIAVFFISFIILSEIAYLSCNTMKYIKKNNSVQFFKSFHNAKKKAKLEKKLEELEGKE